MDKPLVRIRNVTLTRDFVLFMIAFGILMTILLYNPAELKAILTKIEHVLDTIVIIAKQNGAIVNQTKTNTDEIEKLGKQNLINTESIINDSAARFEINGNRTVTVLNELRNFINSSQVTQKASESDLVKVLFLYLEDMERDINKLMVSQNITNEHFISINGTHAITETGIIQLPYPINVTSNLKDLRISNFSDS